MKAEHRPEDKLEYYLYILYYVNDISCIHHDPDDVLSRLNRYVPLKAGSVRSTNMYLGKNLKCMQLHNGIWAWSMSSSKDVREAVRICKECIAKHLSKGNKLLKRADDPFENSYCPELDVSPVLGPDETSYYQSLIGVMRLVIKMGRININAEISLLSKDRGIWRQCCISWVT